MKIKVWDFPTRAFHWLLVLAVTGAFFTSRSEWLLEHHTVAGYLALGLVVFRILWGFAGNRFARFSEFIKGWGEVRSYLKKALALKPPRHLGHNPAVGWVVIFMLLLISAIIFTGIITYSGEENRGLWAGVFSYETARYARGIHDFLTDFFIAVIVIHVCAALFHDFILKENIIVSMITGTKEDEESWSERVSHMHPGEGLSAGKLIVWILVAVMGGLGLVYLPPEGKRDFSVVEEKAPAGKAAPAIVNKAWKAECATSCHSAFHPTLLPAGSWKRIMSGLDDHFGDNVSLDEDTKKEILEYLTRFSAERSKTEASRKILISIKKGDVPTRITETPYWKAKHSDIKEEVYRRKSVSSKSNCVACHPGAEAGSFEDKDIRIPEP